MSTITESDRILAARLRDGVLVAVCLGVISYFHYYPLHLDFMPQETFHILLRRLYYIPILYAAFRFGIRGGLLASLTATVLFVPHAAMSMGGFFGQGSVDNFFDIVGYNVVALITGLLIEVKRRQNRRYQEVLKLNQQIEQGESAIRSMKSYTESILGSIGSAVISTDGSGRIVTANPAARRLLGRNEEDLIGFPLDKVFAGHSDLLRAASLVLTGTQNRATLETTLTAGAKRATPEAADGAGLQADVTAAIRITPLRSRGQATGTVITLEDLTEVRSLTEQLMRADRLSNLGELVAGVAHEVRNPLGVIKASVQMMEQEMAEGCRSAELTHVMVQEIDRLDSVVNALLDFGRPSESQFGAVEAAHVLDDVVLLTKQFAHQQKVEVRKQYADGLQPIRADEDRLRQVFVNLISNAIQAMPRGGSLTIGADCEDGFLRLTFGDTGVGIPEREFARIFDPFHTTRPEGSGLGLAIVHRIIDAHNGFISVDSRPGEGATFTVGLPLAIEEERTRNLGVVDA